MTDHPQAGARVRIVIEDTIEYRSESGDWTTTGGINLTGVTTQNATTTILEPGWQPGDIVNDGHSDLIRVRREDGVCLWQRVDDGRLVYDDETTLASLTVIRRSGLPAAVQVTVTVTHMPDAEEIGRTIGRALRRRPGGSQ